MLNIYMKDSEVREWDDNKYTEYDVKGKFFVVIRDNKWVGMYALEEIYFVEYKDEDAE